MIKFSASSMQEIADHFDNLADSFAKASQEAKTAKSSQLHKAKSATWYAAARFVESSEIKPLSIKD